MTVERAPLQEAIDFFERHSGTAFRDAFGKTFANHFFSRKSATEMMTTIYVEFVSLCATSDKGDEWLDQVSRELARQLVVIMVNQRELQDHVVLASRLPFYGFPSPSEILYGEKSEESK